MITDATSERFRQPVVKRLGFEDGWWLLSPHFLKLGMPLVLVDECLLPESASKHLEVFGARRPQTPFATSGVRAEWHGHGVLLRDVQRDGRMLAWHWFRAPTLPIPPTAARLLLLVVGDSSALQASWSALWTSRVGVAAISRGEATPACSD